MDRAPTERRALAVALARRGLEVAAAANGLAGLHLAVDPSEGVDLLVTDLEVPGLRGEALVRSARLLRPDRELAVVVASALLDVELCEQLRQAGADAVIAKQDGLDAVVAECVRLLEDRGRLPPALDAAAEAEELPEEFIVPLEDPEPRARSLCRIALGKSRVG